MENDHWNLLNQAIGKYSKDCIVMQFIIMNDLRSIYTNLMDVKMTLENIFSFESHFANLAGKWLLSLRRK